VTSLPLTSGLRSGSLGWVPCAALITATLFPLSKAPSDDSFPLSTYPMFARPRSEVHSLVVRYLTYDGLEHAVPTAYVGTREVLQAARLIRSAWRAGRPTALRLLQQTSARLHAAGVEHRQLRLVESVHDPIAYFTGDDPTPLTQHVLLTWSNGASAAPSGTDPR